MRMRIVWQRREAFEEVRADLLCRLLRIIVNTMLLDRAVVEQAEGAAPMYTGTVPCWQSASRHSVRSTLLCRRGRS